MFENSCEKQSGTMIEQTRKQREVGIMREIMYYPEGMTKCEKLHLFGNGCFENNYDVDCDECPFNQLNQQVKRNEIVNKADRLSQISPYEDIND